MVVVGAVIGLFVAYCALLAMYAVWRDFTLTGAQKVLRTVYVWLVPVVGPMLYLRSTAELAPNAVPSHRWLWPVRWLFYVKPSTISCTPEDAADVTLEQFNQRGF